MKTQLALSCLLLGSFLSAEAQQQDVQFVQSPPVGISVTATPPLFIMEGQETATNAIILDRNSIESVRVYKGEEARSKLGEKGEGGAVVLSLKEEVPLVRVEEVYRRFNVYKQQQSLKVAINDRLVTNPALILADLREIEQVEIKKQDVTAPIRWSFDADEEYLNIITSP